MSIVSAVGLQPVPLVAGAAQARLGDPTVDALLDYFAFWIGRTLEPKTDTMTAPMVADPLPTANRYAVNPQSIIATFARPALFAWWSGKSVSVPHTVTYNLRQRDVQLMYVYEAIHSLEQLELYSGIIPAVDAALHRASHRLAHPEYSYGGFGLGANLRDMAGIEGLEYLGGQEGFLSDLVRTSAREAPKTNNAKGPIQRGYPALHATVRVWEKVFGDIPQDPADVGKDFPVTIQTSEGTGDEPFTFVEGFVEAPDGADEP